MKLVDVEYTFDNSKILFYFTADGRVDFRALVKDLASVFRTRIELRQIGVRDESKMLGGLGVCGRPFCCSSFLGEFHPVSIKMAKEQGLSLSPTKIILVEGMLILENKALRNLLDIKLFVDTDDDVRLLRRILRDTRERGRSLDEVAERYLATVKPMHQQFVEPSKRYADVIIPEGGENAVALLMLIQRIAYHIENGDIVNRQ